MAAVIAVVVLGFLGLGTIIAAGSMRDGPAPQPPLEPQQLQQQPRDAALLDAKIEVAKIQMRKKEIEELQATKKPDLQFHKANLLDVKPPTERPPPK